MFRDNSVFRKYTELYKHGISSQETPFMKYGFFKGNVSYKSIKTHTLCANLNVHRCKKEIKYYKVFLSPHTGQFEKTAIRKERCINIYKNRMKINHTKKVTK